MAFNTIAIVGTPVEKERLAGGAITPGHLIEIDSSDEFIVHATGGGTAATMFALEDDSQGNEITDAYASGARVFAGIFRPGDEVYALIANGENIAIGDDLISNGNGELKEYVVADSGSDIIQDHSVVAVALQAVDMSSSSPVDPSPRCRVMII